MNFRLLACRRTTGAEAATSVSSGDQWSTKKCWGQWVISVVGVSASSFLQCHDIFHLPPSLVGCKVLRSNSLFVWLSVCLSARISKTAYKFHHIFCTSVAVVRSSDSNAMRYVHRVLWMTSRLRIIRYDTMRYGKLTCAQKLTRWPA